MNVFFTKFKVSFPHCILLYCDTCAEIHIMVTLYHRPIYKCGKNISVKLNKIVGMAIVQKSKEARVGMKDGNGIQPTICR